MTSIIHLTDVNVVEMIIERYENDLRDQHDANVKVKGNMMKMAKGKIAFEKELAVKTKEFETSLHVVSQLRKSLMTSTDMPTSTGFPYFVRVFVKNTGVRVFKKNTVFDHPPPPQK